MDHHWSDHEWIPTILTLRARPQREESDWPSHGHMTELQVSRGLEKFHCPFVTSVLRVLYFNNTIQCGIFPLKRKAHWQYEGKKLTQVHQGDQGPFWVTTPSSVGTYTTDLNKETFRRWGCHSTSPVELEPLTSLFGCTCKCGCQIHINWAENRSAPQGLAGWWSPQRRPSLHLTLILFLLQENVIW